jgi:hypothetical protein
MNKWKISHTIAAGCTVAALTTLAVPVQAANLVANGSFEDLGGTFVNTSSNYMSLAAGSTAVASWTVSATTTNEIVWGKSPTSDGHRASDGTFFLDLTGFGAVSPNGAIQQTLQGLTIGQQYSFSIDVAVSGALPAVTVNGVVVGLIPGGTFVIGSDTWTHESGTFVANVVTPALKLANSQPGQQITFIDNVVVSAVPEPTSLSLFALGMAAIWVRRRCA